MQTFLPYPSLTKSVQCLDWRRLGKQRVEAMQILRALEDPSYGWQNHPAVKMWRGYENALKYYMNQCIGEWEYRGYKNNMDRARVFSCDVVYPPWFGDENFHNSHKSNLLRKDPDWYGQFGWGLPSDLPYVWPKE